MRNLRITIPFVFMLAALIATSAVSAPPFINYQAVLKDGNGNPVSGTFLIHFSIWNVESGGNINPNQLWNESQSVSVNANGSFHVQLGRFNQLTSNIFAADDRWLEIQVDGDLAMTPRTPIGSVPYSLLAGDVTNGTISKDKLQDNAVGANKIESGAVGSDKIEGGAVGNDKLANGAVGSDKIQGGAVGNDKLASGAVGSDKIQTGAVGNAKLEDNAVGSSKIQGNAITSDKILDGTISLDDIASNGAGGGQVMKWNNTSSRWEIGDDLNGGGWVDDGTTIRLEAAGDRVGIGVPTPFEKLEVDGNIRASGMIRSTYEIAIDGAAALITAEAGTISFSDENIVTTGRLTIGPSHTNSGVNSLVAGNTNQVSGLYSSVTGGMTNSVSGSYSTVAGGRENYIYGDYGALGGGQENDCNSRFATIGGGFGNVSGYATDPLHDSYSTVGGGTENRATGDYATVPGGTSNYAHGKFSLAGGALSRANHDGAIVLSAVDPDAMGGIPLADSVMSGGQAQMVLCAHGRFYLTDNPGTAPVVTQRFLNTSTGAYLSRSGSWTNASDRNLKENFESVDGQDILEKLRQLPVTRWNYKSDDSRVTHIGPVAQDFHALFSVGQDDVSISSIDPSGIALAAIKELYQTQKELMTKSAEIDELREELKQLKEVVSRVSSGGVSGAGYSLEKEPK